ncbi:Domain of uncharacterised function (DUF2825) [Serratia ficaria]|nr:Domain of uncharacterised function (DUF2825) [Serratia ficaria]
MTQSSGLSPLARGTRVLGVFDPLPIRFIPAGAGNTISIHQAAFGRSVYPRWRGEHALHMEASLKQCGLSPLARGTQEHGLALDECRRFIPAGAGNTVLSSTAGRNKAVYPRWGGEHPARITTLSGLRGLSPLARGTLLLRELLRLRCRFIPAGAGNTRAQPRAGLSSPVYPPMSG